MGGGIGRDLHEQNWNSSFPHPHVLSAWVPPPQQAVCRGGGWKGVYPRPMAVRQGLRSPWTGSPQHVWAIR